jgi:PAS domain S-box-containing protein
MQSSIRTRLMMIFTGLAIGPLLLVGIVLTWQSFVMQQQQALSLQAEVAQRVTTQVTAFFEQQEDQLHFVSQIQRVQRLDQDQQRRLLLQLLTYQDTFEELALLDNQGHEQIHLTRLDLTLNTADDRSEADEFVFPRTTGQVYYGPVRFDEVSGEPSMNIGIPLFDLHTGVVNEVLVAESRLKKIWNLIAEVRVNPGQSVYIVDSQGRVVAHRNPSVVLRSTHFDVPDGNGIFPGLNGSKVVLAVNTIHLGQQEFYIVVEQTLSEALALAINTVLITAGLMLTAFVLSVILGGLMVRQIVRPIQAMAATAEAISAGDLSQQVTVARQDELGSLAVAFNNMTTQLRQSLQNLEQRIIEIKQAEASLRQANETLQALFDYSPLDIHTVTPDGHVLLWNKAAERMYGWTSQETLGTFLPFFPEEQIKEYQQLRARVDAGESITGLEAERMRKDGTQFPLAISIAPLRDAEGTTYAYMSIGMDITERKRVEHEREALIAELETKNAELERFTYTVSHDLKSPLITIGGFVGLLEQDALTGNTERVKADITRINDAVAKMQRLLGELLELSRIGRLINPPEEVSLVEIANEAVELMHGRIAARGVEVKIASMPTVYGDRARLVEAMQNLVDNACKFMGDQPHPRIEIGTQQDDGELVFYVRDNGIGIDPQYHEKVFGLFDKLDPASEGTGVGLALVKRIIETHGGRIWIKSEGKGNGTTFLFTLPEK